MVNLNLLQLLYYSVLLEVFIFDYQITYSFIFNVHHFSQSFTTYHYLLNVHVKHDIVFSNIQHINKNKLCMDLAEAPSQILC